jgi:hypothetical protein
MQGTANTGFMVSAGTKVGFVRVFELVGLYR